MLNDGLNIPIDITANTGGANQTAQALDKVAQSTKHLTDETERYQQALKRMAEAQASQQLEKNSTALKALIAERKAEAAATKEAASEAARYEATLKRMADTQAAQGMSSRAGNLKQVLAERKAEAAKADKEILDGIRVVSQEEVKAATESTKAAEKAFISKQQLKEAVKGLGIEFPLLGQVARLALNPITLIVAGIGSAFAIWKMRVEGLTQALAGVELPQVTPRQVEHVTAMAKAWNEFSDAITKAAQAFGSVEADSDRIIKKLAAQLEMQKKMMAAQKELELAKLESQKANLPAGQYELQKAAIETRYGQAGIKLEEVSAQKVVAEKYRRQANLIIDAQAKMREARGIRVASAEDDATTLADMKAQADASRKEIEERTKRRMTIADARDGGLWSAMSALPEFYRLYGPGVTGSQAIQIEADAIERARIPIQRYEAFARSMPLRERARRRREELTSTAGREAGEAFTLEQSLPGEMSDIRTRFAGERSVANMGELSKTYQAAGAASQQANQILEEINRAILTGSTVWSSTLRKLEQYQESLKQAEQRISNLEGGIKANQPSL